MWNILPSSVMSIPGTNNGQALSRSNDNLQFTSTVNKSTPFSKASGEAICNSTHLQSFITISPAWNPYHFVIVENIQGTLIIVTYWHIVESHYRNWMSFWCWWSMRTMDFWVVNLTRIVDLYSNVRDSRGLGTLYITQCICLTCHTHSYIRNRSS